MPLEWEALLNASEISKEEVLAKPDAVLSCLETQSKYIKGQENKQAESLTEKPKPITAGEIPEEKSISLSKINIFDL